MTLSEVYVDLFNITQGFYLAYCTNNTFTLDTKIAKQFIKHYNMKEKLTKFHFYESEAEVGEALLVDNVFNLITKERSHDDSTYEILEEALYDMKYQLKEHLIKKLAISNIGFDNLDIIKVKRMFKEIFEDMDIEILISIKKGYE
jgi:hypothetical protein